MESGNSHSSILAEVFSEKIPADGKNSRFRCECAYDGTDFCGWQSQIGVVFARLIVRVSLHFLASLYHALIKGIDAINHFFFGVIHISHNCPQVC